MPILPEFLCYKYEDIKTVDEIMENPTSVGWKCRKYIRWKEIQNEPTDGDVLRFFADGLIDSNTLNPKLYGAISRIFLNVQKWRIDKEDLAIEPPYRPDWEAMNGYAKVAQQTPAVIPEELFNREIPLEGQESEVLQILFYVLMLDEFFASFKIKDYVSIGMSELVGLKALELGNRIHSLFEPIYTSVGIKLNRGLTPSDVIQNIYQDLGIDGIKIDSKIVISSIPVTQPQSEKVIIEYVCLERFRLVQVVPVEGTLVLRLNLQHPFIEKIATDKQLQATFEHLFRAYALSVYELPGHQEVISTFTAYLGLWLMRLSESKKIETKKIGT